MGELKSKRIIQTRNWLDPNQQPIPPYDFENVYPISVYDAIRANMDDNSPSLTDELNAIYRLIADKQNLIQGGTPGKLMTWSGIQGEIGSMDTTKAINQDPASRSHQKIPTERAVGDVLDTKATIAVLNIHTNDASIHLTDIERSRWNSMAPLSSLQAHISNAVMHVTNDERNRWNSKAEAADVDNHLYNTNNPHNVTAHQVGTYARREVDEMFAALRESFFNYLNIAWDDRTNTAELVNYHPVNWNPNYVLEFNDPLPDVEDPSQIYFAVKPATDYSTNETSDCIIFIKRPGLNWQEVGSTSMHAGDMIIKFPDTIMFVWIQGRFLRLFSESGTEEPGDGLNGNVWRPSINDQGLLSWSLSKETTIPSSVKIKGEDGYTPIKGIDYDDGKDGEGVPVGGNQSEVLVKLSDQNFDTTWKSLLDIFNDLVLAGIVLPENIVQWDNIKGRPKIYNELGPNDDGVITQKAATRQFEITNTQITEILNKIDGPAGLDGIKNDLYDHINDYNNPHRITPSIIGAVSISTHTDHIQNFNNPHNTNKDQIGLSNADNTSDIDKPISTATQNALDLIKEKLDIINSDLAASKYIVNVTWDNPTNNLVFEFKDGTTLGVTIPITDLFNKIYFDNDTKELVIVLPDDTENRINISALIQTYYGSIGANIQVVIENDNVVKASIIPSTVGEHELTPSIHLKGSPTTTTQSVGDRSTKVATTEFVSGQVINNLISYETDRPLSANMGRLLNLNKADIEDVIQIINDLEGLDVIDTLDSTSPLAALSANMGRYLDLVKAPRVHTSPSGTTFGRATISLFGHTRACESDPLMDGTVFKGTDDGRYARGDHRHPTDITRAPLHFPDLAHDQHSFTGEPRTTTPPNNSNDDRIPNTEWVRKNAVGVNKGFCNTAGNANVKVVTLKSDFMDPVVFLRQTGSSVVVTFDNTDISTGATQLDVQGSGAAPILYGGLPITPNMISVNHSHLFTFDGTKWRLLNPAGIHTLPDGDNSNRFVSSEWVRKNAVGVLWGTSDTVETTAVKIASLRSSYVTPAIFTRQIGSTVVIKFTSGDNSSGTTQLDVQGTGAAPILYESRPVVPYMIDKDLDHIFTFDGTNWRLLNPSMMGTEVVGGASTGGANQMTEYLGFTVEGHGGTTNVHGEVNRALITIPFKTLKPEGSRITISNNIADWAARMGDNQLVNLSNPTVLFSSRGHGVIQFTMASYYPSNSPCGLVARRPQALIKIESDSTPVPFKAVTSIDNVPDSVNVGDNVNLLSFQVAPVNATNQTIVWSITNAGGTGATINTGILTTTSSGSFILRAVVKNGASPSTDFVKDFNISVNAASISITSQPALRTEVIFGNISGSLSVAASIVSGTLSYQWYSNTTNSNIGGVAISGATNSIFTIPTNLTGGTHYFFCEVKATGGASPIRSNPATVIVVVKVTGVTISPKPANMVQYETAQVSSTISPSNATNKNVIWSSGDNSIATITITGILTAINNGSTTITATTIDGGFVDSFNINVINFIPVTDITGIPATIFTNDSVLLSSAAIVPSNANKKNIIWSIENSNGTNASILNNVLTVSSAIINDTKITIKATITDGMYPGVSFIKNFVIIVKPDYMAITDIILADSSLNTRAGEPLQLVTTIIPFNATNQTIIWSFISGTNGIIASITNGVFVTTSGNDGWATVEAKVINGASKTTNFIKQFDIHVGDGLIPVTSISGVPSSIFANFKTHSIDIIVIPSIATNKGAEFTIVDSGATNAIFNIDDESLFAPNIGTFKLKASIFEGSGYGVNYEEIFSIDVIEYIKILDITNIPNSFRVDQTLSLSGTINPSNSTYKNIIWSIVNDGGTNSTITNGKLTSTNTGIVKVEAKILKGKEPYGWEIDDEEYDPNISIDYTKEFDITVLPSFIPVTNISNFIPQTMSIGDSIVLSGTVEPSDATMQNIEYEISDNNLATLENNKLTAIASGILPISLIVKDGISIGSDYIQTIFIEIGEVTGEDLIFDNRIGYDVPGIYEFIVPDGITKLSAACVGGGSLYTLDTDSNENDISELVTGKSSSVGDYLIATTSREKYSSHGNIPGRGYEKTFVGKLYDYKLHEGEVSNLYHGYGGGGSFQELAASPFKIQMRKANFAFTEITVTPGEIIKCTVGKGANFDTNEIYESLHSGKDGYVLIGWNNIVETI